MLLRFAFILLFCCRLTGQSPEAVDRQDQAEWAKNSGLPVATVQRLWRTASHFADEQDDDSRILLIDARSLASRNQILMVTAAGVPSCLALTVFSKGIGNAIVWSESETSEHRGFCENLGIEPEVRVTKGEILVKTPGDLISPKASHAEVTEYIYTWTGKTYVFGHKETSLEFVPAANRITKRPE
jgi:hypothetical protein